MSLKSTMPRKKFCQQSETLLPETVANLGPSAVKVSPHCPASIFPFPSRIVISYVLPAFWFPFEKRASKGTEKFQAQQVERLLLFSPPSYHHWPTYLQLRYIRRWAPFGVVSNMRWSGVRIRMTYIAAVGHNIIPPGMHRYASRFTLSNVFLVSSCRTTSLLHAWLRALLSWFTSNAEYARMYHILPSILLHSICADVGTCFYEQCCTLVHFTEPSYQAWFLNISPHFSSQSFLNSFWEFSDHGVGNNTGLVFAGFTLSLTALNCTSCSCY